MRVFVCTHCAKDDSDPYWLLTKLKAPYRSGSPKDPFGKAVFLFSGNRWCVMERKEKDPPSEPTIRQYAVSVFHNSLVTGVPNIIGSRSWKWKIFKLCVLVICISGFLYQTITFLGLVLSYPSVVEIHVTTPEEFLYPAFTFCNINGIKRSKFCEMYPDRCETPGNRTQFCNQFPHYCRNLTDWENFKVPKQEYFDFENTVTLHDLKELGHEKASFMRKTFEYMGHGKTEDVEGPLIFFKNRKTGFACYSLHSRVNSSLDPPVLKFPPLVGISIMELSFNFEEQEMFIPGRQPGGLMAIHSPFHMENPYDFGHFIKPGKIYKVHLRMEEEELLPYPYRSECTNYTKSWLENGRAGPRSQEMCKQSCLIDLVYSVCNCSLKIINYPVPEDMCFTEDYSCLTGSIGKDIVDCMENYCTDDCQKYKFMYIVEERAIEENDWLTPSDKDEQRTYVHIYTSDPEVVVYKYRPHYQDIEVFSYIGGYIGAWLGISLVAVADLIESSFRIAVFAFRKRKQKGINDVTSSAS